MSMDYCLTPLGQRLVEENMRLVTRIVNRYPATNTRARDDIDQDAYVALSNAVATFDESKGFRFSTYAWRVINNALQTLRNEGNTIRLPANFRDYGEVASVGSLTDLMMEMSSDPAMGEDPWDDFDDREEHHVEMKMIKDRIRCLPPRTRQVIKMRLGGMTHQEIADQFGCTKENPRSLERSAIQKISRMIAKATSPKAKAKRIEKAKREMQYGRAS